MDLLTQMATFVRVVDGNSLSAAARASRLSLPAVSRQLQALEADLGASLIVRSTRRLHVTDAGRQWYQHCVRVLREIDEARAEVRASKAVRGTLVVSASLTYGTVVIVPKLAILIDEHPHLVIELRLEDRVADLVGEGVDVALRTGPLPPDSTAYVAHPLSTMERILVAAPGWLRKHGTPKRPEQVTGKRCLVQVTPAGAVVRWRLRRQDEDQTEEQVMEVREMRGGFRSNAPVALRDLAIDGAGIAYLPSWLVEDDIAKGRLRRILPRWSSPPITAWAVYRAELRGAPRLRAFLEAMPRMAGR
jgi:DNA-binding transcriptional LysR family regulator